MALSHRLASEEMNHLFAPQTDSLLRLWARRMLRRREGFFTLENGQKNSQVVLFPRVWYCREALWKMESFVLRWFESDERLDLHFQALVRVLNSGWSFKLGFQGAIRVVRRRFGFQIRLEWFKYSMDIRSKNKVLASRGESSPRFLQLTKLTTSN